VNYERELALTSRDGRLRASQFSLHNPAVPCTVVDRSLNLIDDEAGAISLCERRAHWSCIDISSGTWLRSRAGSLS
jgi:hypothetical protein